MLQLEWCQRAFVLSIFEAEFERRIFGGQVFQPESVGIGVHPDIVGQSFQRSVLGCKCESGRQCGAGFKVFLSFCNIEFSAVQEEGE